MVLVRIEPGSSTPPFEQVRLGIAERVRRGELVAGTKLPTVRALAAELGLAVNTVARAYREGDPVGRMEAAGRDLSDPAPEDGMLDGHRHQFGVLGSRVHHRRIRGDVRERGEQVDVDARAQVPAGRDQDLVEMVDHRVRVLHPRAAGGGVTLRGTGQIVLAGIAGSQLFNALTSFIITKSANAEQARGIMFWLLGNLSGARWPDVWLAVPVALVGLGACIWYARALDAFSFGAESAASLGVPVRVVQVVLIGLTALVTAVMVSIVGSIGFVGLVIPHAARFLVGVRHGRLGPTTALIGAVFLIAADILSRTIVPGQVLPIGVITALVGAPAFALILIRGRRRS